MRYREKSLRYAMRCHVKSLHYVMTYCGRNCPHHGKMMYHGLSPRCVMQSRDSS
jgi:hypothetical protein